MPSYQSNAVSHWWKHHKPDYTSDQFNTTRMSRGVPDVSANGFGYQIVAYGHLGGESGTSAAAPVIASIITLLNQVRLDAGKSPLGFINPLLYANAHLLTDITQGNNAGCGTAGFSAVEGWVIANRHAFDWRLIIS